MKDALTIGVIGGSGLYAMEGLEGVEKVRVETPFGMPSDDYVVGTYAQKRIVFLPRHGVGHRFLPNEINFRANIWGMKKLGVSQLLSVTAVGSLKEEIVPGHLVLVDQFVDLTKRRISTFFGNGAAVHVSMANPVCPKMQKLLVQIARDLGVTAHDGGTYVCIEGPQYSSRAESNIYRSWGAAVVGMTNMPEAKLAREAEIAYAPIALATDYDCWRESEEPVNAEAVVRTLAANVDKAKRLIRRYLELTTAETASAECTAATRNGLVTERDLIPPETRAALEPLFHTFSS